MVKIICPVCNVEGILQVRGSSKRIVHYRWVNGKRIFSYHKLDTDMDTKMDTMDTAMETEKTDTSIFNDNRSNSLENNFEDISVAG